MKYNFYKLDNGVKVVLVPMQGVRSIGVGVYVQTGSRYENTKINGISHFLEHMVFKGTKNFPTHKDTSRLEGMGAIQNAWTDVDATAYWCKIPSDRWDEALDLIKDLALYPKIPAKDLEIERGVILEEINRREDRPDEISAETLLELMYSPNALGMTTLGTPEVIKSLKRGDFADYHGRQYVAGRLTVVVSGKIEESEKLREKIQNYFGSLPAKSGKDFEEAVPRNGGPGYKIYKKELASQVHIQLAFPGLTMKDKRRFGLSILTSYMGRGLSSRLFTELREKRGLCYAVAADESRWTDTGVWSVYAGLNISKLEEAVMAIADEISRLKEEKLTDKELEAAKEKIRGPLLFGAENPVSVMNYYARQVMDRPDEILTYDQLIISLMQIDSEEVRRIAREVFDGQKLNLAVVGPVEEERVQKLADRVKI